MKMKKVLNLILVSTLLLSSCDKDPANPPPGGVDASVDIAKPVISLIGASSITIQKGTSYSDAGATASDNIDGDITSSITTSGNVDTSTLGEYILTYSASDAAGNSISLIRTITVIAAPVPLVLPSLTAVGTLSEQTPAEAKKIIYGKWDFSNPEKSFNKSKTLSCDFDFIEFDDETYYMGLIFNDKLTVAYGYYDLSEDSQGNVSSVDLFYNSGDGDVKIATLTNVVVVEIGDGISATFDIDLNIPEDIGWTSCNDLSGVYTDVGKDEPMDQSYAAVDPSLTTSDTANVTGPNSYVSSTDHALLINGNWSLDSVSEGRGDGSLVDALSSLGQGYCFDEVCTADANGAINCVDIQIPNCSGPTSLKLDMSAYGTYVFSELGGSEGPEVDYGTWTWIDEPGPPRFYARSDDNEIDDASDIIEIIELSEKTVTFYNKSDDTTLFFSSN